ncbi:MAG: hypothetical protein IPG22_13875 [Acidobacteria bacterium]|nr:hypothetical protein [Acidobacteriota bacterium]
MRYIQKEELVNEKLIRAFERLGKIYVRKMEAMTTDERKQFIRDRTIWNRLQELMFHLSRSKCWYSEAPPGAGDYEIDHFRPKNRSKQFDGSVLRADGYWWLAFDWTNYRLSGGLVNKRRRDRLGENEEVKGKGDYFPLDFENGSQVAEYGRNLNIELPILLDPTVLYDTSLISFDKNGQVIIPSGIPASDRFRAEKSIFFYHLDLEQLDLYRAQVWKVCEDELKDFHEAVTDAPNEHTKREVLRKAGKRLIEITGKEAPFSRVAWACIEANLETYSAWLRNLHRALV